MVLTFALGASEPILADVWDLQTANDNTTATQNELIHGSDQLHDLGALAGPVADVDWYRISQRPYASYQILVDAVSGDLDSLLVDRIASDGTSTLQISAAVGAGFSRSLAWMNATASTQAGEFIRVMSGSCTTDCGPDDVYRIRVYETTYAVPRFNNSGTQTTVLLLQNPTSVTITGDVYFWSTSGTLLATHAFTLSPKNTLVLNTSTVPGASGVSGALTIAHTGGYGELAGKAVALEPATGFSFDTPLVPRS